MVRIFCNTIPHFTNSTHSTSCHAVHGLFHPCIGRAWYLPCQRLPRRALDYYYEDVGKWFLVSDIWFWVLLLDSDFTEVKTLDWIWMAPETEHATAGSVVYVVSWMCSVPGSRMWRVLKSRCYNFWVLVRLSIVSEREDCEFVCLAWAIAVGQCRVLDML